MVPFNHPKGHGNIPPTYFQVCGLDALRDDSLIYERLLREESSIATRLDLYPGLPHHFWEFYPQLKQHIQKRTEDTVNEIQWLLEIRG
jgi:acetyl esterase/lipase